MAARVKMQKMKTLANGSQNEDAEHEPPNSGTNEDEKHEDLANGSTNEDDEHEKDSF